MGSYMEWPLQTMTEVEQPQSLALTTCIYNGYRLSMMTDAGKVWPQMGV